MKLQHYFTLLVLATVITLIGAAEWTQSKKSADEKREAFYASLSSQTASLENSIKSRIENLRYQLAQAASRHTDSTSSLTSDSAFSAIAWLQKNPPGSAAKYRAVWAEANTQSFDPSWLKGLNFSQVKDGETLFVRRVDRSGNAFFALVMTALTQTAQTAQSLPETTEGAVDDRVYLFAAISPSTLSAWVDDWVGSSRAAFVFDEHGNVVSHSQRQYAGTNLSKDKLVNSSMRSGRAKITTEFSDLESEARVGESLKVGQTNLRAAVSVPKAILTKAPQSNRGSQRGLMVTIGLFLVGIAHLLGGKFASRFAKQTQGSSSVAPLATASNVAETAIVQQIAQPEPELTFEDVEQKTRLNLEEILARSAEIRQRLQVDFIESVESEQKLFFEELASHAEATKLAEVVTAPEPTAEEQMKPKVKVRRPKVSL